MSIAISKLDHFKLQTEFGDGWVINSTFDWELSTKRERFSTWSRQRLLGTGAFGSVYLEKESDGGQLRAVKMIRRNVAATMGFTREILALISVADASPLPYAFVPELTACCWQYTASPPLCGVLRLVRKRKQHLPCDGVYPARRPRQLYQSTANG